MREYEALRDVFQRHINGWREAPKPSDPIKTFNDRMALLRTNTLLSRMKPGDAPPEGIPDLFTAPYKGRIN